MGSGVNSSAQGKYTGNGTGASSEQEIKTLGFQPKYMRIESANGSAEFWAGKTGGISKRVVAGDLTFLASGLEFTEFGFKLTGDDVCLNDDGVVYDYSCY